MRGAYEITPFYATDERGGFIKDYNIDAFKQNGTDHELKKVFYTVSKKDVVHAMHFRLVKQQAKLVCCISGHVYDVIIDPRPGSPAFGKWQGLDLTGENQRVLYMPWYFGHGYLMLEDSVVSYKCGEVFYGEGDTDMMYNNPDMAIKQPFGKIGDIEKLIISDKDKNLMGLEGYIERVQQLVDKQLLIYVSSPDSCSDVLAVFLKGCRGYWSDCPYEFILTTNTKSYEGIACMCNNKQDDTWAERTMATLSVIKSEYVMLMRNDIILDDNVDSSLIERLLDYMDNHEIRYCSLGPTPEGSKVKSSPLLRSVNKQIPYAINLRFGTFRKDLFVELLGGGSLSAWDIENSMNGRAVVVPSEDYRGVVAVSKYILPYIHGVCEGRWIRYAVENLSRLSLYIDSGRGIVPLSQRIKIDMTNWLQWEILLKQRRTLKNVLSRMGMRFATKR